MTTLTIVNNGPPVLVDIITTPPILVTIVPPVSLLVTPVYAAGPAGPPGPPGVNGIGAITQYTHYQSIPALVWTIVHGLSAYLNVTTVQNAGSWEVIEGDVRYIDANTITVTFAYLTAGQAYIS